MRLLLVSSWFPSPPDNGSRLRAFHLIEGLSRRHQLTLLTFSRLDDRADDGPLRQWCEQLEIVPLPRAGRLTVGGLLSATPRSLVQTDSPEMRALIGARADAHDLIVAFGLHAAVHVAKARVRRPAIFEEAELGAMRQSVSDAPTPAHRIRRALTWWKHRTFVVGLINQFQLTTVVSEPERDLVASAGGPTDRIRIVPNGTDLPPEPIERPVRSQVVYPGAVAYSANLDAVRYYVDAILPLVRAQDPAITFVVTGSTSGVDVSDLASTPGVRFTDWLPDIRPVLAESLACVVPLRHGGGTRLKVLEAMAVGVPVISSGKGIEGLDVEAERHFLRADTAEEFAAQVTRLAHDPSLRQRLVSAGRDLVASRYDWNRLVDTLDRAVMEAASSPRGGAEAHTRS